MAGETYASGNWVVRDGSTDEFIARWSDFLEWTKAEVEGFRFASLIRETPNPSHFISFAEWDSDAAMQAWRSKPAFAEKLGACRELCDDFRASDYVRAVSVE
jgi:heme-degrading monooxygenase HmoA